MGQFNMGGGGKENIWVLTGRWATIFVTDDNSKKTTNQTKKKCSKPARKHTNKTKMP